MNDFLKLLIFLILILFIVGIIFLLRDDINIENYEDIPGNITNDDLPIGGPGAVYNPNDNNLSIYLNDDTGYINYFNYFYPYQIFHKKFKGNKLNYGRQLYGNLFLI